MNLKSSNSIADWCPWFAVGLGLCCGLYLVAPAFLGVYTATSSNEMIFGLDLAASANLFRGVYLTGLSS